MVYVRVRSSCMWYVYACVLSVHVSVVYVYSRTYACLCSAQIVFANDTQPQEEQLSARGRIPRRYEQQQQRAW